MSTSLIFGLGVASAVVVILIIALVVMVLRLNKGLNSASANVETLFSNYQELNRQMVDNFAEVQRQAREMKEEILRAERDAKSYADSRIDKALVKQTPGNAGKSE